MCVLASDTVEDPPHFRHRHAGWAWQFVGLRPRRDQTTDVRNGKERSSGRGGGYADALRSAPWLVVLVDLADEGSAALKAARPRQLSGSPERPLVCQVYPDDNKGMTTDAALSDLAAHDHTAGLYQLRKQRWHLINEARNAGATWDQIGQALGVTKQSAHELWTSSTDDVMAAVRQSNAAARSRR